MKKIIIIIVFLLTLQSFSQIIVSVGDKNNYERITKNTVESLEFEINIAKFNYLPFVVDGENFCRISIPNYYSNNELGFPELPIFSKLIAIPNDAEAEISIVDYNETIVPLNDYGYNNVLFPNQKSISKDNDNFYTDVEKNPQIYINHEFYSPNFVEIKKIGTFRGTTIAQILINPFSYDIATNTIYLKNKISVKVKFLQETTKSTNKTNLLSKEFLPIYQKLWNFDAIFQNVALSTTPIKYLIISDRMFETELQNFITWKTMEGYDVSVEYTDIIGNTKVEIKSYIQNIYENSTPSYLLLVGDVEQIPAFTLSGGSPSDLYYCTFDGGNDFIPEMFYGRLSAQNTTQLHNQIEKIIQYEKCNFSNLEFLKNATLIAGYDSYFGYINANGQINYISYYYFNQNNGINSSIFLCPDSQNSVNEIKSALSAGNSFVNYTAHCLATQWSNPNIKLNDVYSLTNDDKVSFVLANCCLSSKYSISECIGESFMRTEKTGAATYVGSTDLTYWTEDFYWTVGFTNNISANPNYENKGHGVFDKLMHKHLEEPIKNAAQMIFAGNMIVTESNSQLTKNYWEIYNTLGDPSLMPFVGMPDNIYANYPNTITSNSTFLNIYTEENCYVAISMNNSLIDAKYSDQNGFVHFDLENLQIGTLNLVITKQFKIPLIEQIIINNSIFTNDIAISQTIDLQNNYYNNPATIIPKVEIINLGNTPISAATINYSISGQNQETIYFTETLNPNQSIIISFNEILLPSNIYDFEFNATIANDGNISNNSISKTIKVFAGNIELSKIIAPENIICSINSITPEICIKNIGNQELTSLKCKLQTSLEDNEMIWHGSLLPDDSIYIAFPPIAIVSGDYTINFEISEPNDGINENLFIQKTKNFSINNNGSLITIEILTDDYGSEVSWELFDLNANEVIIFDNQMSGAGQTHKIYQNCFDSVCLKFSIFDSFSDGMHENTMGYVIITKGNDTILNIKGDEYTSKFEHTFCINSTNISNKINYINDSEFLIFPNPTNNFINIKTNYNQIFSIEVFNAVGEMLLSENNLNNSSKINVGNLKDGLYFVKIIFGDKVLYKKFMVQK